MSLRFLFGMLASVLPDQRNHSEMEGPEKVSLLLPKEWKYESGLHTVEEYGGLFPDYIQGAAQFHIGMLTISLIVGLAYGGFVGYTCWMEKNVFLGYIRNLLIALVCRTFFTILFDGVILLGTPTSAGGGNTLTSFEQICINLVLGFWLSLTVYAHARVQRNFKSEPTLRLYQYGIPVVAAFFAFVWIFTMQDICPNLLWWAIVHPINRWIVNAANLLFLLIQLGLVGDMCRMMMAVKSSLDNDSVSLLWKVAAMMGALVFIFWLQFGLSLGLYKVDQSYLYFFFFIDGIECTLVCACFYFFNRWVTLLRNKSHPFDGSGETEITTLDPETEFLPGGRGVVTVDSICVTRESGRWKTSEEETSKDVVYSNVVDPHRLQKTLELYKRLNVIPSQVTVVEGDQFYDCQTPEQGTINYGFSPFPRDESFGFKNEKTIEPTQKKNAFYASKYLILDSKENEFPKYLQTRPSVSSVSEKDSQKEEETVKRDPLAAFEMKELVTKWLKDNSENMPKSRKASITEHKELIRENSDLKTFKSASEENASPTKTNSENVSKDKTVIQAPEEVTDLPEMTEQRGKHVDLKTETEKQKQIGLQLNTKNDVGSPIKNETPTSAQDISKTEDGPSESVPSQPLNASKMAAKHEVPSESLGGAPTPTKINEPEVKDEPTGPPNSYLTYSELLEFRSKRGKSDEPPVSAKESIFSKLMNASGSFLNSLTGVAQAEHLKDIKDFRSDDRLQRYLPDDSQAKLEDIQEAKEIKGDSATDDGFPRQPQIKYEPEPQRKEDIRHEEPKPYSQDFTLPETPTAVQPEYIALNRESITVENDINENKTGIPNTVEQSIRDRDQSQHKPTDAKDESPKASSGYDLVNQSFVSEGDQLPHNLTEDDDSLETSSSEFSIERRRSFSSERLSKRSHTNGVLRTSDAETKSQVSETSSSGSATEGKQSSSSVEFSLEKYYTNLMTAKAVFDNQRVLRPNKSSL